MKQLALLVSVLFIAALLYVIFMPPRQLTLKDLQKDPLPNYYDQSEPETLQNTLHDSYDNGSGAISNHSDSSNIPTVKLQADPPRSKINSASGNASQSDVPGNNQKPGFYIVIESCKSLAQAQQRAEKLRKSFNANIFALPPTTEGICRISYGKYSSLEEARSVLNGLKSRFGAGIWIYSPKK